MTRRMCFLFCLLAIFTTSPTIGQQPAHSAQNKPRKPVPTAKIEGGVEITSTKDAQDMALPHEQFKGIHFFKSSEFFTKFSDRKNTPSGLYLLDTELIPKQLHEILAKNKVALGADGSVINQKGEKVVMLLGYRVAAVNKKSSQGGFFDLLGPTRVFAASPFPLEWVSFWYSWVDNEGFCRSMTSSTEADAWGPIVDAWGDRVRTQVDYIEAAAYADVAGDDEFCFNCAWQPAQANINFGCFWPAHGSGQWGWALLKDGSFNWSGNW